MLCLYLCFLNKLVIFLIFGLCRFCYTRWLHYSYTILSWCSCIGILKQLIPPYVNIRVNGNNPRCQKTKNAAIRYRINQELKFQYAKKQQLNEQLYKIHLECATFWPTTWQLIQSTRDSRIQQQMEEHYQRLNKKIGSPSTKTTETINTTSAQRQTPVLHKSKKSKKTSDSTKKKCNYLNMA